MKGQYFYVDPAQDNRETLLNHIKEGKWLFLYGPRASGKTTRIERAIEQLDNEFCCLRYHLLCFLFSFYFL
jgi:predicted AAA+ superfamily ATPase